jgi:hypothetical protein
VVLIKPDDLWLYSVYSVSVTKSISSIGFNGRWSLIKIPPFSLSSSRDDFY